MTSSKGWRAVDRERLRRLGGCVALIVAGSFALAILVLTPADAEFGYDLDAYLGAADHLMAGQALYPLIGEGGLTPIGRGAFFYPPVVAVVFIPLGLLPAETATLVWYISLIALAAVVGVFLVRPLPPVARTWAAAGYLAYLPLLSEIRFGNVNLVSLALCLLAWALRGRPALAGLALAGALGLKLLPLTLVVFLVVAGRWRIVAWSAGAIAMVLVASWPWLGSAWFAYGATIAAIGTGAPASGSNIVPELLGDPPLKYLLPVLAIATATLGGWLARRRPGDDRAAFLTALAASPLAATTVWYTYLVMALPALLGSDGGRPSPEGDAMPVGTVRGGAWAMIEARLGGLPLIGLAVLVGGGLLRLARGTKPTDGRTQEV